MSWPTLKFKWFSPLVFALQTQVQVLVLHLFRFIYLFSHDGCMQKERKVAACAFMNPRKLMHIDMELTLFLVYGVEADMPKKWKKINVGRDSNLGAQEWRLASSPSELEHTICIFTRTVLLIYFKCQNIQVKASVSRRMV